MTDTEELAVGPELDAAVAEMMGDEVNVWRVQRSEHFLDFGFYVGPESQIPQGISHSPSYTPYSTTDEHACKVLDWLVGQGWDYEITHFNRQVSVTLSTPFAERFFENACCRKSRCPTRAEAICRAALKTREK